MTVGAGTEGVERILVVTAHPDDVDFGVAGSVAVWTHAGVEVAYCIATDGDAGGSDRSVTRADMAVIRRSEQVEAAHTVGVGDVTFLGFPDGRLLPDLDLRRAIARTIRQFRPDRVVAQSPERNWARIYASHPDHLAAGEAAACAVDRAVDATEFFELKLAALRSHRSQVGDGDHLEDLLRGWMSGTALAAGLPDGRLAEAFHVVATG
jgi:LmbE family N-acetylglucosaminyl deacetylase